MTHFRFAVFGAFAALLVGSGVGCELIAGVDANKVGGAAGGSVTTSSSSSGGGGAGGHGGMGAGGSDGGVMCSVPTDCPTPADACSDRTCTAGTCGEKPKDAGTPIGAQTTGDCKKSQCDGAGKTVLANDDADLPDDKNDCTDDVCTAGKPSNPSKAAKTACGLNGKLLCDGAGLCVGCLAAADCAGQDTECQKITCTAGVCGVLDTGKGTPLAAQTAGDCKVAQCDGNGATEIADDNSDVPDDQETCTKDLCNAGVPSNPPVPASTVCSEGTGTLCDGAGKCAQCLVANDCPGVDTECQQRACNAGVCGTTKAALGTVLASQTAGDCQKAVCDGLGGTTTQNDDTDAANDNNVCTNDLCMAGVPSHTNTANGSSCGGSLTCLNGACTGCGAPSDCPGVDDECKTRTCAVGVCGLAFTASGTPVAAQTAGDCSKNQCDGSGNTVSAADNTDVPADDGNQCTDEVCSAGVPQHPLKSANTACSQNGGAVCSAAGQCVACNAAAQCPGVDTDCKARSCTANACGFSFQSAGTVTSSQTPGDCEVNQCDGAGNVVQAAANGDVPADDGNQCTSDVCNAGAPVHPPKPVDTACSQGGGSVCNAVGACVQCNAPAECPGTDTECHLRTCAANACGVSNVAAGTATSGQTMGDCQKNQCDGAGNITSAADNTDVPADDGNQCTGDVCTAGVPAHPALPMGTACNQGGTFCDGAGVCVSATCNDGMKNGTESDVDCGGGACPTCINGLACGVDGDCQSGACAGGVCVQCNVASQCPGSDTECHTRTCSGNTCGVNDTPAGTPTVTQTAGDCMANQCDGLGNSVAVVDNTDVPADDGDQCTAEVCTAGVPSHPAQPFGTACSQGGGTLCDGTGTCVAAPQVASTSPSDATTPVAGPAISVTFTVAMDPATLTGQTVDGACTGSIQVSLDGFASCIAFSSAAATMSGGNTTASFTAAPGLLVNRVYQIRVTTAAQSAIAIALPSQFTQPTGFTTTSPDLCDASIVISQVYGGGGLASATYKNDFIELHNRGTTSVSLAGLSVQYAATGGTTWSKLNLVGSVPAGGYFLIQMFSGGAVGAALPAPDQTGSIDLAGGNGKVALVSGTVALAGACPLGPTVLDLVGYGTANCSEGGTAAGGLSSTTAAVRVDSGCGDVNMNNADFSVLTPAPRNSVTATSACACTVENESNVALEADYCDTQFPLSLTVANGSAQTVFGRIFESGITGMGLANASVRAQLGYGPATANPEYEAGWTWTNATYNAACGGCGSNDEYQATFTTPAVGTYRYVYRFSLDQGVTWTYADNDQADFGAGSNANLTFDFANEAVLTSQ